MSLSEFRKETGEKAYPMPFGGSTSVGMFGYVNAFDEMEKEVSPDNDNDIYYRVEPVTYL